MIDCHCHLNFKAFEEDIDEIIKHAKTNKVSKIINVGTSLDSSEKAIKLAKKYDNLYATVGIHPHHADKHDFESNLLEQLEKLAKFPKVVAIGEIGLDYFSYKSNGITDKKLQKDLFEQQIMLAYNLKLPLQIHNRQAGSDILDIITSHKSYLLNPPGVFHCFSGDLDFLKRVLNLGFYIGFDGNITYPGIAKGETTPLLDLVKHTPINRIITETDSPYLSPLPHRGQRNIPSYVIITGEFLAKLKDIAFAEFDRITSKNAEQVFNF